MKRKEKVILYGASARLEHNRHAFKAVYDIVGISDSDSAKKDKIEAMGEKFIEPRDISEHEFDRIIVTSTFYNEISLTLIHVFDIDRNKIVPDTSFFAEKEFCLGELNPEKTFYVFRQPDPLWHDAAGLFSVVSVVVQMLRLIDGGGYDFFADFQNYKNMFLEDSKLGKENAWEYFFKQPCGEKCKTVYNSKNVVLGSGYVSKLRDPVLKPDSERSFGSLKEIYKKYIVPSDDMQNRINEEYNRLFKPLRDKGKKICAVSYRGTEYTKLKPYGHYIQPTIGEAVEKTKQMTEEWGFDYIYFDSEDNRAFEAFRAAFPHMLYSERARLDEYPDGITDYRFNRENDKFLRSMEYMRSIYLLAKCDYFIGAINAGTVAIMNITEGFLQSFVFSLGIYGVDSDSYIYTPGGKPIYIKKL